MFLVVVIILEGDGGNEPNLDLAIGGRYCTWIYYIIVFLEVRICYQFKQQLELINFYTSIQISLKHLTICVKDTII